MEDWVEVRARDVEEAVEHGLKELGGVSREAVEIEVIEEPTKGFLGVGAKDAVVRVKPLPRQRPRRRQKGGGKGAKVSGRSTGGKKVSGRSTGGKVDEAKRRRSSGRKDTTKTEKGGGKGKAQVSRSGTRGKGMAKTEGKEEKKPRRGDGDRVNVEEQAGVVGDFLRGLLDVFGIEGVVDVKVDEDIIYAGVSGGQSEALVGQKGVILQAVLELTRTVVQRKTQAGARLRLDISGYVERRREALKIYAGRLAEKVLAGGGEVMLEAMNPADRKVVHDAVAEVEGVRSFSEGEEPERSVVIALEESGS
jgi:spoIIIJ-associated protein